MIHIKQRHKRSKTGNKPVVPKGRWWQFGRLVRAARKKEGLTQVQLASLLGSAKGSVSYWETGTVRPTDVMLGGMLRHLPTLCLEEVFEVLYPESHIAKKEREND